jgi:hypothetical protein
LIAVGRAFGYRAPMLRSYIVGVGIGLVLLAVGAGCGGITILEDGSGGSGGAGSTTGTSASTVVTSTVSKSSSSTGFADLCQAPVGTPCTPATFPTCDLVTVSGIPCCFISKTCTPTGVDWQMESCTDDCAQSCELITNPEHCEALGWCTLGPEGCTSAPPPP